MKPRVLFVSRRVDTPLSPSLERKWSAVGDKLDFRVLAGGAGGNGAFHLVGRLPALDGAVFFAALPARIDGREKVARYLQWECGAAASAGTYPQRLIARLFPGDLDRWR